MERNDITNFFSLEERSKTCRLKRDHKLGQKWQTQTRTEERARNRLGATTAPRTQCSRIRFLATERHDGAVSICDLCAGGPDFKSRFENGYPDRRFEWDLGVYP